VFQGIADACYDPRTTISRVAGERRHLEEHLLGIYRRYARVWIESREVV
jgi:hypothetical protein